jgi:hypothetical protein
MSGAQARWHREDLAARTTEGESCTRCGKAVPRVASAGVFAGWCAACVLVWAHRDSTEIPSPRPTSATGSGGGVMSNYLKRWQFRHWLEEQAATSEKWANVLRQEEARGNI